MKKILYFFLLSIVTEIGFAQKSGNIWYFGQNAGLDFNNTPPTPLSNGQINTIEGCSSIADPSTGSLLFYTDGINVWTKNHVPMPACIATPLNGDPSSTQSGVIIPQPGNPNIYYVFTTPAEAGSWSGHPPTMCYSIVDMTLNGGNGDLTTINVPIIDTSTEKIAAVGNCTGTEYWIVGHKWHSDSFYAYKLTVNGLIGPVKSKVGSVHTGPTPSTTSETIGYMKFSSDGKMIGLVNYMDQNIVEIFNFDNVTGIVTSCFYTEQFSFAPASGDGPYGCSFSPDNTKFYISIFSVNGNSRVYQYDVTNLNQAAVAASKTQIGSQAGKNYAALQNGTDGKMYVSIFQGTALDVINDPNLSGIACNLQPNAINLSPNTVATAGLPVIVESFLSGGAPPIFNLPNENKICKGDTIHAPQTIKNNFAIYPSNSIHVYADSSQVDFFPTTTTTYTIVNSSDCATDDTTLFTITIIPDPKADFIFDPLVPTLRDNPITLVNQSINGDHYEWYYDNILQGTSKDLTITNPGKGSFCYTLIAYNELNCSNTLMKCITIKDTITSSIFIPNAFSPNGDGTNDVFRIKAKNIDFQALSIYNRFGQLLFNTPEMSVGWNGDYKGKPCEIGTYFYVLFYGDIDGVQKIAKGDFELIR